MLNIPAGWKPISSAPKDGTDILLTNGVHVSCGHWHYDEGGTTEHRDLDGRYIGQDDRDGFAGWFDWMGGMTPNPTHWMPLPAAPGSVSPSAPGDAQDGDRMTVLYVAGAICRHLDMALDQSKVMAAARDIAQHIAAPAAGDALDAARYRWLRDNIQEDHSLPGSFWLSDTGGESWDKTIDAAMAYQRQQGEAA
ncbi:hypothetical protein [Achromobacter denitrificans]|uniref:hypothetical protein n=1 Tax=Achromobacter denitrificans TaxID=32002 RepID=UPI003CFE7F54